MSGRRTSRRPPAARGGPPRAPGSGGYGRCAGAPRPGWRPCRPAAERIPSSTASPGVWTHTTRSPVRRSVRNSGDVAAAPSRAEVPRARARGSACASARAAAPRAVWQARCAAWRPGGTPRCRGRFGGPAPFVRRGGLAARRHSMTPKSTPLPPCTAHPAGLFSTISPSSSWRTRPLDGQQPVPARYRSGPGIGEPHRRHPHDVAGSQPVVLSYATAVDAHLPAAQQPVDPGAWNALEMQRQEVVDALAAHRFVDDDLVRGFPSPSVRSAHRMMVAVRSMRKS